jgi:serine kinase of HPr protein (carbohydrate metabolism regulator)
MTSPSSERLHASCVAITGRAVLIEGLPGSGKSDLSLRLIDRGARLVSDDQTIVTRRDHRLIATAPATIAGRIEVRGLGIVALDAVAEAPVALIVSLSERIERMPDDGQSRTIAGLAVPHIALLGHEPSAPIKVELALDRHGLPA